ncbi:unnamed protein product [Fusarium venenatum]|uniref:Uncharacterized protein n=1 Tax=Fusarium venenatum TaxID=56646 RepID=A0A2L2TSX4_9HYPO|nr:uncharacterized protein FVRRES_03518 [Fusarium venenatum]CEI67006.1 unnamed protein product [Fusarium venenatum]
MHKLCVLSKNDASVWAMALSAGDARERVMDPSRSSKSKTRLNPCIHLEEAGLSGRLDEDDIGQFIKGES